MYTEKYVIRCFDGLTEPWLSHRHRQRCTNNMLRVTVIGPQPVYPDLNKESRVLILVKIAHERVIEFRG